MLKVALGVWYLSYFLSSFWFPLVSSDLFLALGWTQRARWSKQIVLLLLQNVSRAQRTNQVALKPQPLLWRRWPREEQPPQEGELRRKTPSTLGLACELKFDSDPMITRGNRLRVFKSKSKTNMLSHRWCQTRYRLLFFVHSYITSSTILKTGWLEKML